VYDRRDASFAADRPGPLVTAALTGYEGVAASLAQRLQLTRPLAFIDLETTGTNVSLDRIVEIAVLRVMPDGSSEMRAKRVNPGMPIPPESTAVHRITDADIRYEPEFWELAGSLATYLADCDFAGFGVVRFDMKLLEAEFRRAQVPFSMDGRYVVDAMAIFFDREPRNLSAAVRFYCGKDFEDAHAAREDVLASLEVLAAQFDRYEGLPTSLPELGAVGVRRDPNWIDADGKLVRINGEAAIGFGKHRGHTLSSLRAEDPGYLRWILSSDFSEQVKVLVREAFEGDAPLVPRLL
jgi:DNA polymerase-3 subunit epsilon